MVYCILSLIVVILFIVMFYGENTIDGYRSYSEKKKERREQQRKERASRKDSCTIS